MLNSKISESAGAGGGRGQGGGRGRGAGIKETNVINNEDRLSWSNRSLYSYENNYQLMTSNVILFVERFPIW